MHSRLPRGVRPRLLGKPRTPLSSQVAMRISWSPLSGLKGVQLPLPFGERTRDCSAGHAGKEGPQLARTGASQGFPRAAAPVRVFSRGTTKISGSLLLPPIPPRIRVFSNESTLCMRWPKYWSFSFSISPSKEIPGLISFRMDWLDLLQSKGLSRVFSNTTVQKHQFFGAQLSSQSNSHMHT